MNYLPIPTRIHTVILSCRVGRNLCVIRLSPWMYASPMGIILRMHRNMKSILIGVRRHLIVAEQLPDMSLLTLVRRIWSKRKEAEKRLQ